MEKSGVDVQGLKDFFVQLLGKCDELGIPSLRSLFLLFLNFHFSYK